MDSGLAAGVRSNARRRRMVMTCSITSLACALVGFAPETLVAQRTVVDSTARDSVSQRLVPVNVRSTRSGVSIFNAPLAITRIARENFAGKAGFGLNDAMATVPGALVQSRYGTSDVRITIRGFGARGAGDRSNAGTSRGIRVLMDGMPETEPDGRTSFDNVDLASAEGIDVIRSNASSLWGNAAGGVVSISTVPQVDKPFMTAQAMNGTFGLQRYIAQAGAPLGSGVAYATLVNTTFDGWRANSSSRRVLFNAGIATPVSDKTLLRVHLLGANNLMHIPGPLSAADVATNPRQANATYAARDERRFNRLGRLGVAIEHQIDNKQSLSAVTYVNPKYLQRSERGTFRDFTRYHVGGNVQYNRIDKIGTTTRNRINLGLDQAYQDGTILFYTLSSTNGRGVTLRDNKGEGAYNSGLFVEDELTLNDKISVTLGARGDAISYYYKSFSMPQLDASKRFARVTPKLGATYRFSPTHTLYVNVGGGIEAPAGNETDPASTFGQDTITALNPLLAPIRSTTYEVGTKHVMAVGDGSGTLESVSYDMAGYLTNVTNEIVPYRGGRFYFTAGQARRVGAEVGITAAIRGGFRWENAFTLSQNKYQQYVVDSVHYGKAGATADYAGNKIVGIPDYFYGSTLVYGPRSAPRGISVQVGMQGTGRYFADDANTITVPESHILSVGLRSDRLVRIGDAFVRAFINIENVLDRRWIGSAFLNPDVVNGAPIAYEPGMPRSVTVSLSITRGR